MVTINSSRQHGLAKLESVRGRLRIRFPRTCFNGQKKYLSLNLADTPSNRAIAERKLQLIQVEIDDGKFDLTLERYQPQAKQKSYLQAVSESYPEQGIKQIWEGYLSYIAPTRKFSTMHTFKIGYTPKIEQCEYQSPFQAIEIRNWLLSITTPEMTKRILVQLNAACKWAIKHKKLNATSSPFEGMASDFDGPEKEIKPCAFTLEERDQILEAYKSSYYYKHYASFVEFLFLTGCRPHEAVGLEWKDIDPAYQFITFNGGIYCANGKHVSTKGMGSKNNKIRKFPINARLRALLESLERQSELVFPSPKGTIINYANFLKKPWHKIVDPIKVGTTPYSCRDTFITEQVAKGVNAAIIAKWVDNSVKMIEKHYLDMTSINHILPQ